ncbi:MAG: MIP/aquaporin family protein [Micropruina sp.]|uniref:MIP/aquaporin family protein n=1 Tax=Micropruina sp. TaxID=2737536 RepID=UPI0039E5EECC
MPNEDDEFFQVGTSDHIHPTTASMITGEILGSFLLAFIGIGIGLTSTFWSSADGPYFSDIFPVVYTWAFSIGLSVYVAGPLSGAHFNPAVTLALASIGRHPWRLVPLYIVCQMVGWFLGAAGLVLIFRPAMEAWAKSKGFDFQSEQVGALLTTYAPNPGFAGTIGFENYSFWIGFAAEVLGTAFLLLFILSTGASSASRVPDWAGGLIVGSSIGLLLMFFAPISQACFNPARDLGPRLVLLLMGFGDSAFPGTGVFTWSVISTTIGPIIGGVASALIFTKSDKAIRALRPKASKA